MDDRLLLLLLFGPPNVSSIGAAPLAPSDAGAGCELLRPGQKVAPFSACAWQIRDRLLLLATRARLLRSRLGFITALVCDMKMQD
jgi:hypothetical protein